MESNHTESRGLGRRLRTRLPELLIEAFSVMLAVLIALAVDEWREERANREVAQTARTKILEEIEANRDELVNAGDANAALLGRLRDYVRAAQETTPDSLNASFEFALLSRAAWQTAQMTRAAHFLDYDWMAEVARLYNLQELYDRSQTAVVEHMSGAAVPEEALPRFLQTLEARVTLVATLHDGLEQAYAEVLKTVGDASNAPDREPNVPNEGD